MSVVGASNRFSWLDYFWAKVEKGPDCWIWKGSKSRKGYGKYTVIAHKVAYELAKGRVPDGLDVLHSCDNPLCVNPEHLRAGSTKENMSEASRKGRMKGKRKNPHTLRGARGRYVSKV